MEHTSATPSRDLATKTFESTGTPQSAPAAPRHNLYAHPHKALRLCLSDTLALAGRVDPEDAADVAGLGRRVREMLRFCRAHLDKEEHFVHPAIEARRPGAAAGTHADHREHLVAFAELDAELRALESAAGAARERAATRLYHHLAVFVADNLAHMQVEETVNNEVLWADYDDDELRALEARLVASIPQDLLQLALRWMVPAMNPAERAGFLGALRASAPAAAFAAILASVEGLLADAERRKLTQALAA